MDGIVRCFVVMVSTNAMLAGCASIAPANGANQVIDSKRVAQIDQAARRAGLEVRWINYPRKTVQ